MLLTGISIEKIEAQFSGKFNCPESTKKTKLGPLKDQGNKRLKLWCIGTMDERNKTGNAFIATEIVMTMNDGSKMSTWIHRCGFTNGDNQWTDRVDITKKIEGVNIKPDGSRVEYSYDVQNEKLTITVKDSRGMVIDTRMVEKKDLSNPLDVPHPGDDLNYNNSQENSDQPNGCFFVIDGQDLEFELVGGEMTRLYTINLLLAGAQSTTWLIPVMLTLAGIGLFIASRKSENS